MPAEIRIYFEGDKLLRPGFGEFFRELKETAHKQRCGFRLISAKSGEQAKRDLEIALKTNPDAWSILLIDSEGPLPRNSARSRADRVFWMVEMMEAWFHADAEALAGFYRKDFRMDALKANRNVELIPKKDLVKGLKAATKNTTKGDYNKTTHALKLLARIDPV